MKSTVYVIITLCALVSFSCGEGQESKNKINENSERVESAAVDLTGLPVAGYEGDEFNAKRKANNMYIRTISLWSDRTALYQKPDSVMYYAMKSNFYFPSSAAFNVLGRVSFQKGEMTKAIEYYDEGIALDSTIPEIFFNKGTVYYVMQNLPKACENWGKAGELGFTQAQNAMSMYCQ